MENSAPKTPKEEAVILGQALRRLRSYTEYSQADAAERAGIEQPTWQRYERAGNQAFLDILVQERCVAAIGFTLKDLHEVREAIERGDPVPHPHQKLAASLARAQAPIQAAPPEREPFVFPLDGTVRAGPTGLAVFDVGDRQTYDVSNYFNAETRLLEVVGESMYPILDGGAKVSYSLKGYPKRNHLAVVRMHDGEIFVKKFIRMTDAAVECVEMEAVDLPDGRIAYAERAISYPLGKVRGVYPSWVRMD